MKSGTCIEKPDILNFRYMPGCKVFVIENNNGTEDTYSPDKFFNKFKILSQVIDFYSLFKENRVH
jgi:hypothetical protein